MLRIGSEVVKTGETLKGVAIAIKGEDYDWQVVVRWQTGKIEEIDASELDDVTPKFYVNIYLWDRAFGGREEGNWYYNTYAPVDEDDSLRSVLAGSEEEAKTLFDLMQIQCDEENKSRRHPGSVISEGHYVVELEAWPAEYKPKERPRYC